MNEYFNYIGIVGYPRYQNSFITHKILYNWLISKGYKVIMEKKISKELNLNKPRIATLKEIGKYCDLVIVVGGDGNMLNTARILSSYDIKIIGINRGKLGFLTDLNPDNALKQLSNVLNGDYILENRFLLDIKSYNKKLLSNRSKAINEVVIHPCKISNMIEFEVYIDKSFAFSQRSDGIIISTPTGSTGYALSAGGPIISTLVNAIVIIPMFPQSLSARPLVINNSSNIHIKFFNLNKKICVSCDSQISFSINFNEHIVINRSNSCLNLIHPKNYNYFDKLTSKLKWFKNFF
ncbi:NAD(+) kinase [Buchnera aphidicola (Taiwanaphis decaspermi)]|uniref:NAD(+) kinase n=1 Tax=Buchnera aphidicola TaxID=9 RepID=UPI0031B825EE